MISCGATQAGTRRSIYARLPREGAGPFVNNHTIARVTQFSPMPTSTVNRSDKAPNHIEGLDESFKRHDWRGHVGIGPKYSS